MNARSDREFMQRALREAVKTAPIGVVLLDRDENVLLWNDAAEAMFGWKEEELLGKPYPLVPEDRREESRKLHQASLTGVPSAPVETCRQRRDGSLIYISTACNPLEDETGSVCRVLLFITDITERKAAEAERERLIDELQDALAKVKTLTGLLPICSSCKKIRDDEGHWNHIENYISARSEADFSHGICPSCAAMLYPKYIKK